MKRRTFIANLGAAAAWPLAARAQQESRVRRVGILLNAAATEVESQGYLQAFVREMRQLGWNEGQNLQVDVRWNAGDAALSRTYAAQLIGLMPDVIVAGSTVNLGTVQQATNTIPIVFVQVADPVTQRFVSNMRQPGGNVTGFSLYEFSLGGKWLNLLKEIAPNLKRVAVVFNPGTAPYFEFFEPAFDAAALPLGVQVITVPLLSEADIEPAIVEFARESNGGLMQLGDSFTRLHNREIADLAARYKLPSIAPLDFAAVGGLLEYGPNFDLASHYAQAAVYVDRILKGAKPGDLPIQAPTKYKLVINLKTAKALNLSVPLALLGLADEVIE
jgi:putative tryptophan/tyrosine transport system substrate-binding protein